MSTKFTSEITLGEKYRDSKNGFTGHAVALYFYEHACERVSLRRLNKDGDDFIEHVFDAAELESVEDPQPIKTVKTGGPRGMKPVPRR